MPIDAMPHSIYTFARPLMRVRLLIVTAAFGEGHNSAARNLCLALEGAGAEVIVCDPCMQAAPRATAFLSSAYRHLTEHFPSVWGVIYRSTDQQDFSKKRLPLMAGPERHLGALVAEHQPHAVISTYPIYPYFLARQFAAGLPRVPVFTVVTDSLEINSAWLRAPSSQWLVTDVHTRDKLLRAGIPPELVTATGFPVHPDFARLVPVPADDPCDPFGVVYFPTAGRRALADCAAAILAASPRVRLTLALGRNFRRLHATAAALRESHPGRVRMVGWTRQIPKLMTRHHLVIGKAGGATVHEAIAACCPMLIHHLVPGQEEGNLELLEKIGGGTLASDAQALHAAISDMLADGAADWRRMKQALSRHGHHAGAVTAARYILEAIDHPKLPRQP
jgi:processive 1,2-diacylglycerol beta-glucosyltransferase